MKKLFLSLAIIAAAISVNAQAKTMFGVQAGVNFATIKTEVPGLTFTSKAKTGFTIGALADVDFGNSISFRPELNFIQKGGEEEFTTVKDGITKKKNDKLKLGYIQLSPNFVYNIPAGTGKVFVGIGPEFSFGIGGKSESIESKTGPGINITETKTMDVKFDGEQNTAANESIVNLKSFDYGVNFLAGYKMAGGFFISTGYTLGLGNISPDANTSIKNSGFNFKVGYMFGGSSHAMKVKK